MEASNGIGGKELGLTTSKDVGAAAAKCTWLPGCGESWCPNLGGGVLVEKQGEPRVGMTGFCAKVAACWGSCCFGWSAACMLATVFD